MATYQDLVNHAVSRPVSGNAFSGFLQKLDCLHPGLGDLVAVDVLGDFIYCPPEEEQELKKSAAQVENLRYKRDFPDSLLT